MKDIHADYWFHAVGQGLFSCGAIINYKYLDPPFFRWVYDCGTSSSQRLLSRAMKQFRNRWGSATQDLVVISHFDADHISGVVNLLNEVGTDTLMLPWTSLGHRLAIGYSQGLDPADPDFGFYTNPVRYFEESAEGGFRRIVFVPFSDGEGPPETDGGGEPETDPDGRPRLDVKVDEEFKDFEDWGLGAAHEWHEYVANHSGRTELVMMQRGTAASLVGLWEFVPYNDPATRPKDLQSFVQKTVPLRDKLLHSDPDNREDALDALKAHYLQCFPKSQRNDISLFLYGGPIGNWRVYGERSSHWHYPHRMPKGSIIYTGDGNLSSLDKWQEFTDYLRQHRATRPAVFQVPHHGSRKNWFAGLADCVEPTASVFSSDPSHRSFGHPHDEVALDFWKHQPAQVDKETEFWMRVHFRRP